MATEAERIARWKLVAGVIVSTTAAGLVVGGWLTGAEWLQTVIAVFT